MDEVQKDSRFAHVMKDPRFHKMPRKERKVKIDQRFNAMFKDKKFKLKYAVDKRGRPMNLTSNDHLRKYYDMSDSEDSGMEEKSAKTKKSKKKKEKGSKDSEMKNSEKSIKVSRKKDSEKDLKLTLSNSSDSLKVEEKPSKLKKGKVLKKSSSDLPKDVKQFKSGNIKHNLNHQQTGKSDELSTSEQEEYEEDKKVASASDSDNGDEETGTEQTDPDEEQSGDSDDGTAFRVGEGPDYSRGEGLASSSNEDTDFEDEDDNLEFSDSHWGEIDKDAPVADEVSSRLAICNMDWDRMQPADIYALVNSFKPVGSVVKSVKIYASEFGKQRIREEEVSGPTELVSQKDSDDDEDDSKRKERLRQYQLSRLKYYYAVVECDTPETANSIYEQCDGLEYESSATKIDLRFIPDDMEFDDKPKSEISEMPSSYKPSMYVTTALNQSKVDLTWDEDDKDRVSVTRRKFTPEELMDLDVKEYLASSGSESENEDPYGDFIDRGSEPSFVASDSEDEEKSIEKYRKLLQGIESKNSTNENTKMEMEVTWEPGLKETTESLVKKSAQKKESLTPWEQYMERKKDKKKQKREERKKERQEKKKDVNDADDGSDDIPAGVDLNDPYFAEELASSEHNALKSNKKKKKKIEMDETEEDKQRKAELVMLMEDEDDGKQHFNLKSIMEKESGASLKKKKKHKKRKLVEESTQEDSFKVDTKDPRFEALYSSHLFNIDPSSAEFKKTKAMEVILEEKVKRSKEKSSKKNVTADSGNGGHADTWRNTAKDASLLSLVKSVKAKTQFHQEKQIKKQKV